VLFSSKFRIIIEVTIIFSVQLVSGYAHVSVLLSVVIATLSVIPVMVFQL